MAESNFVDYVKIYCAPERADEVLRICGVRNTYPTEAPTEVTEDEEAMSSCGVTATTGRYSI